MPARDAASTLRDALGSLLHQGVPRDQLEVVVVDDGSTDDTAAVLEAWAGRLPLLTTVTNTSPRGVSAARNQGVEATTGDWVTFLDPDDWYFPGHLAVAIAAAERLDTDFVVCDQVQAFGEKRKLVLAPEPMRDVPRNPRTGIMPTDRSTLVNYVQVSSRLLARRVVDAGLVRFDESLPTAEDREWAWRLLLGTETFAAVRAPGYVYRRQVQGSLTDVGDSRQLGFIDAYQAVLRQLGPVDHEKYVPKVVRDVLAVLHHHVDRREKYPKDVWQTMTARTQRLLRELPRDVVQEQVAGIGPRRSTMIRRAGVHL